MKVRSHIMRRFQELKKLKGVMGVSVSPDGYYEYSFNGKVKLVVNKEEHAQIQKAGG